MAPHELKRLQHAFTTLKRKDLTSRLELGLAQDVPVRLRPLDGVLVKVRVPRLLALRVLVQGEEQRLQDEVAVGAAAPLALVVVVQHPDLLPAEVPADLDDELGGFGVGSHQTCQEAVLFLVFERL